ncbi:DNA mismatch repair protein Mlh1 isoform X2 [Eurytemora carolleeae]|uniref:DNA mismatch repair protein Mlh1 isoform X2 n=1 Tax=Eurytemora carolleeae TaxID=1294199 RepID=UPI000C787BD2|nr:DNA mismatch repair protein Mlh1 isoform X2 [Eurytemora carolleeae]|eukprot:XP_023331034.1 DNA mismatch repair protein Mlh1-like isoform X2 [Eurytemora affinis]
MSECAPGVIRKLDEVVVNRIAAGEVIQRPANALKEMLENSLDAKCSQITVTVRSGGLKLLQIADNGTGIRQEDLQIVAERFTTSKLKDFKDLSSIATYGFRGEALASISHVAHLSILTKTRDSACGYKAQYMDGKLTGTPKPMAANQGTTITVEDLFYNVPNRLGALKSHTEEFNKISEVMTRYAVHNSGVGFTLKKAGETGVEVKTQSQNSIVDNIRALYGPAVAKELVEFKLEDSRYKFQVKGWVSNVNYSVKKMVFLLFINHRLVDSTALRKSIETVYASYLPKGMSPFIYLSLEIAACNVDVNVHPTKHEVFFLHQDAIIEKIQQGLEEKLLNSNASRTFYTQKLLPGAGATLEILEPKSKLEKTIAPKDFVRTDSSDQKLDKFLVRSDVKDVKETKIPEPDSVNTPEFRECKLSSIKILRQKFQEASSSIAREMFSAHIFVGCVNRKLALFQHSTKLYLANTTKLSQHLFRQLMLRDFGNLGVLKLDPAPSIRELALIALDLPEAGWKEEDGSKDDLAEYVVSTLLQHKEMLDDYFSLQIDNIDGEHCIVGLPLLLDDYCPWLAGLPLYVLRLSTEVNYEDEAECFRTMIEETARTCCVSSIQEIFASSCILSDG